MARKLIVEIVGDSRSYERALTKSATATNQFGQAVGTTSPRVGKLQSTMAATGYGAVGLAGAAAGLAVVLGGKSVKAASDLNEEIAKSEQIFESSAKTIRDWSETTAESIGISQVQALKATGVFGGLFSVLGVGAQQNAKLSRSLVVLAADMASFNNASPEEVLIALRSGLAGEAEPLRRFSVFLSEARVQQEALNQTGKESIKQLTNQEKALARYSIIMRDTAKQQGDVARTSESLANQQRKLAAQVADLEAKLGAVLIPTLTNLVTTLNDILGPAGAVFDALGKLRDFGPISVPINIAVQLSFAGAGTGGIRDLIGKVKQETADAVASGLTAGMGPIKSLEDLFRGGTGGPGFSLFPAPVDTRGGGIPGAGEKEKKTAKDLAKERAAAAAAAARQGQAIIDQITRQATAQKSLSQQIAESEQRAAHLRDLIRADPGNVKLQQRLTAEYKKQNSLKAEQVALGKQNAATAKATAAAAKAEAAAIAEARREREKAAREARREQGQRNLFKALGLTSEGDKPTPGSGALIQRAQSMLGNLKLTEKNRTQLKTIVDVLKKNYKKAGKDVRAAILEMLNTISGAGKDADKGTGPLTKGSGLATAQIIKNLGLTVEQAEEIQRRLAHATTGRVLAAPGGGAKTRVREGGFGNNPIFVESHTTINLDGQKVANVVTRQQQKQKRRNPAQKRGPNRR